MHNHVGVSSAVQFLQEKQIEAFLRNIPHISQILNNMLNLVCHYFYMVSRWLLFRFRIDSRTF